MSNGRWSVLCMEQEYQNKVELRRYIPGCYVFLAVMRWKHCPLTLWLQICPGDQFPQFSFFFFFPPVMQGSGLAGTLFRKNTELKITQNDKDDEEAHRTALRSVCFFHPVPVPFCNFRCNIPFKYFYFSPLKNVFKVLLYMQDTKSHVIWLNNKFYRIIKMNQ